MPTRHLTGQVIYVRNGHTIEVGGLLVRLNGLAEPEGDGSGTPRRCSSWRSGGSSAAKLDGERTNDRCARVCYFNGGEVMVSSDTGK